MNILANNIIKILNFLLRNLDQYNINQIARKLKISVGSSYKILKNLEFANMVNVKKLGNAIYYSLNFNYPGIMELLKLALLEDKDIILKDNKVAKVYVSNLERFDAKAIILFGSILTKKNEAKDVDVLFIIKSKNQIKLVNEFCLEISKIRTKKVNALVMLEEDFTNNIKNNKAVIDLIKYGIILKGEDVFIKAIKNARRE